MCHRRPYIENINMTMYTFQTLLCVFVFMGYHHYWVITTIVKMSNCSVVTIVYVVYVTVYSSMPFTRMHTSHIYS